MYTNNIDNNNPKAGIDASNEYRAMEGEKDEKATSVPEGNYPPDEYYLSIVESESTVSAQVTKQKMKSLLFHRTVSSILTFVFLVVFILFGCIVRVSNPQRGERSVVLILCCSGLVFFLVSYITLMCVQGKLEVLRKEHMHKRDDETKQPISEP